MWRIRRIQGCFYLRYAKSSQNTKKNLCVHGEDAKRHKTHDILVNNGPALSFFQYIVFSSIFLWECTTVSTYRGPRFCLAEIRTRDLPIYVQHCKRANNSAPHIALLAYTVFAPMYFSPIWISCWGLNRQGTNGRGPQFWLSSYLAPPLPVSLHRQTVPAATREKKHLRQR